MKIEEKDLLNISLKMNAFHSSPIYYTLLDCKPGAVTATELAIGLSVIKTHDDN